MNTKLKLLIGGVAAAVVIGGATAGGLAYADPTPSPSPTAQPSAQPGEKQGKHGKHRRLLARALHGEVTLGGGAHRVVVFQRGVVTKVSATEIELRSADGYTASYAVDAEVRVRVDRERGRLSDVKAEQKVRLVGTKDDDVSTAKRIIVLR